MSELDRRLARIEARTREIEARLLAAEKQLHRRRSRAKRTEPEAEAARAAPDILEALDAMFLTPGDVEAMTYRDPLP